MAQKKHITVKKVGLKNNCPECFSTDGLQLTFKQEFTETKFYKSITDRVSCYIDCTTCATAIYPERWTDDIERVVSYQEKALTPKPVSKRFKPLFWGIAIGILFVVILGIAAIAFSKELL